MTEPKSPAAALTAYARSDDRVRALRAGFHIHLAKPIGPAELVTTVAALIRRFAPDGAVATTPGTDRRDRDSTMDGVVDQTFKSWNRLTDCLSCLDQLRTAA